MRVSVLIMFLLVLLAICSYSTCVEMKSFPPKSYHFQAERIDLVQKKITPIEFWFKSRRLRVDYNKGIERKFMEFKKSNRIMVYYEADVNGDSKLMCAVIDREIPRLFLPHIYSFKLEGEELRNGEKIQVYLLKNDVITRKLYLNGSIPIKYEEINVNKDSGALMHHVVTNYFSFETEFNETDLDSNQFCSEQTTKSLQESSNHNNFSSYSDANSAFNVYKLDHGKIYNKEEHEIRKQIFMENWRMVKEHNNKNKGYELTLNHFADLTPEELRPFTRGVIRHQFEPGTHPFPHTETEIDELVKDIPEEFDWRIQGKISNVKSQGSCGSCWAFAATAAIEGALSIKLGANFDLSEQSIIDCDWPYESKGCYGGMSINAFQLTMKYGIPTEEAYGEYLALDGKCHIKNMTNTYKLKGYTAVTSMSVNALKFAVYKYGPVPVGVFAEKHMFFYANGIYNYNTSPDNSTNHEVVVVGYGVRDDIPYWILKNSWGQSWGEDGYILISSLNNAANLLLEPSYYPLV